MNGTRTARPRTRKQQTGETGPLVIIGGAEERAGACDILRTFVRLAGGRRARLAVITTASQTPTAAAEVYQTTFKQLGVRDLRVLDVRTRAAAGSADTLAALERATGVFFTGGDQLRITRTLGGTKLDAALHRRHAAGLALAGTSAGAAMMSGIMIVSSQPVTSLRAGGVELGAGMEFLRGVLIDQHFEERGRLRRLLSAVAQYPHELGLGIDENTAAVVVRQQQLEVIGAGAVTIIDAGGMTYTNPADIARGELLAISGVRIHVLPAGYRFDLQTRTLLHPDGADA
jgi:cyanophycinase